MSKPPLSDEELALELIETHLSNCGEHGYKCERNKNDPPDIIITWNSGERWGVEVTRTYQQVEQIGKEGAVGSETVGAELFKFGEHLEDKFASIRSRNYALVFEGPGPFNLWTDNVAFKQWKKDIENQLRKHIELRSSDTLRFRGGVLRPSDPGIRWLVSVENPATELATATSEMLRCALKSKTHDLPRWDNNFTQRWLLLLNCYPVADHTTNLVDILRCLGREVDSANSFDGLFWSGFADRTLNCIYLAEKQ